MISDLLSSRCVLFRSIKTKEEKSSFPKSRVEIRAEKESQVFGFGPQTETGLNHRLSDSQEEEVLFQKHLGFGQEINYINILPDMRYDIGQV